MIKLIDEDERATVDKDVYYLGDWDNRAMISCWQSINVHGEAEGEDMDYWFYFIPIEKDSTTIKLTRITLRAKNML